MGHAPTKSFRAKVQPNKPCRRGAQTSSASGRAPALWWGKPVRFLVLELGSSL